MLPVIEGPENVLTGCVAAIQKPYIFDAERGECAARLLDSDFPKRASSLVSYFIAAAIARGAIDHGDAFPFVFKASEVAADGSVVIRVCDNEQDIRFEAQVGLKRRKK